MDLGIAGKWALVCGASKGLGFGCAQALVREGVNVLIVARGADALQASRATLLADPARPAAAEVLAVAADITTSEGRDAVFAQRADFDIIVTNAGGPPPGDFRDWDRAAWIKALDANMLTPIELIKATVDGMAARGFGRIVHASSIGVKFGGGSDNFCYSLSKHAQEFIPSATRRLAAANVLVNVVRVGVTDTRAHARIPGKTLADRVRLIPRGQAATAEEMAETLVWLGSEANATITGQVIAASGGE